MPKPLLTEAFCAVGSDLKVDIDLIRRTAASAQYAATTMTGSHWPAMALAGWAVVPVRIYGGPALPEELVDLPPPRPSPARVASDSLSRKGRGKRTPPPRGSPLLRCGD